MNNNKLVLAASPQREMYARICQLKAFLAKT